MKVKKKKKVVIQKIIFGITLKKKGIFKEKKSQVIEVVFGINIFIC